jgi:syntaxin 16
MAQDASASAGEARLAKNAQMALAARVQELSSTFRKKQSIYLKRTSWTAIYNILRMGQNASLNLPNSETELKGHEIRHTDMVAPSRFSQTDSLAAVDDDEQLVRPFKTASYPFVALTDVANGQSRTSLLAVEEHNESVIDQRDREITAIAGSIADLAELFRDLNLMVIDQGTLLDRIDYNIEQMATDIRGAVEELETATKSSRHMLPITPLRNSDPPSRENRYQKRTGKRWIVFLLVLLIVGAIIVLVYKPRRDRSSPTAPPSPPPSPLSSRRLDSGVQRKIFSGDNHEPPLLPQSSQRPPEAIRFVRQRSGFRPGQPGVRSQRGRDQHNGRS